MAARLNRDFNVHCGGHDRYAQLAIIVVHRKSGPATRTAMQRFVRD